MWEQMLLTSMLNLFLLLINKMDLTLFILTVVVLMGIYYAYTYLEIMREELNYYKGNVETKNTFKEMINNATYGLNYLKEFI